MAEVYTTLSFVSDTIAPTLFTAFILESVNRVINVAFKFIPLRTGVDEYGSGALAKVLGFTKATGVTLAIVRKARDIFWTGIGVALQALQVGAQVGGRLIPQVGILLQRLVNDLF